MDKICFKCGELKSLDDYYKHSKMGDGHLNKCKECTKKDADKREKQLRKNPEWCEKERLRSKEKYHRLNYKKKQHETKSKKLYGNNLYYKRLHEKLKTLYLINSNENVHHWNYDKIFQIFIIDKKDHRRIHTLIKIKTDTKYFVTKTGEVLDTFEKHASFLKECNIIYKVYNFNI